MVNDLNRLSQFGAAPAFGGNAANNQLNQLMDLF